MKAIWKIAILAGVAAAPLVGVAAAQTAPEGRAVVVVTGTRVEDRSALDTAVAVDVVSSEALEKSGITEVNQALAVQLPSFNFPRPALTDGTDTVRPAALRGLAPDQTLVLVNSKRRHAGQRQRLDRPRRIGGRPQHHPHRRRVGHRSPARRRVGPVRL
jgi:iron complex outermembrane recepter protein